MFFEMWLWLSDVQGGKSVCMQTFCVVDSGLRNISYYYFQRLNDVTII